MSKANFSQQRQIYTLLLIITDGDINDMEMTTREIVNASDLPLTIGKFFLPIFVIFKIYHILTTPK